MGRYDADAIAEQWLYECLIHSESLVEIIGYNSAYRPQRPQVYRGVAPQEGIPVDEETGLVKPYVVYQNQTQGGTNLLTMNSSIVWLNTLYMVKVVGESADSDALSRANKAIRDALHQGEGEALEGRVLTCVQEKTFVLDPELVGDKVYETRGGLYRILAQETT